MPPRVLILPGLYDSGPEHWQSHWETEHGFTRVNQRDWDTPDCREWVETLQRAVRAEPGPVVLVAHSLACCLVAHWAGAHPGEDVRGALLVAPSDVEAPDFPPVTGFAPMPLDPLPFPSIAVASTDDEYVPVPRAEHFARAWGSRLEILGALGHINSASRLGSWPAGFALLRSLL